MTNYENVFNSNELIKSGNGYSSEYIFTILNNNATTNGNNKENSISSDVTQKFNKVSDIYKDRAIPACLYLNSFFLSEMNEDNNTNEQKDINHYTNSEVISDNLYNKLLLLSNTATGKKNKKLTKKKRGKKENKEKKGKKTKRNY